MEFIKDNTVANPAAIVGVQIGDRYLVPPIGAAGLWTGKEDQIAVWGGSVWSFSTPAAGVEVQITTGPNAGRIFFRTTVPSFTVNQVPDGELDADPAGFTEWTLSTLVTAVCAWDAGGFIHLSATAAGDVASAKAIIPTIAGMRYDVAWNVTNTTADGTNGIALVDILNVADSASLALQDWTTNGTKNVSFLATGSSTSLDFRAESDGTADGEFDLQYVRVYLRKSQVTNGNFASDFTGWSASPPWEIVTGVSPPFPSKYAHIDIETEFGVPLEQELTELAEGYYYCIQLTTGLAEYLTGTLNVKLGDALVSEVTEEGTKILYFKAQDTSADLTFEAKCFEPVVNPFFVGLDDVSLFAALWAPVPVIKATFAAHSGMTCGGLAKVRRIQATIAATSGFTAGIARSRAIQGSMAGISGFTARLEKSVIKNISATIAAKSGMTARLASTKDIRATIAAKSAMTAALEPTGRYLVRTAVDRILALWSSTGSPGCADGCDSWSERHDEALDFLNAAMQRLGASGKEWGFVNNQILTLTYSGGYFYYETPDGYHYLAPDGQAYLTPQSLPLTAADYTLPEDVISVKSAMLIISMNEDEADSVALAPLHSEAELQSFGRAHWRSQFPTDNLTGIAKLVCPLAFFIRPTAVGQSRTPTLTFQMAPALALKQDEDYAGGYNWSLRLAVTLRPPRYQKKDATDGTSLSVPHQHIETLVLPLARYMALSARWFSNRSMEPAVREQAADALAMVGMLDPAPREAVQPARAPGKEGRL